MPILLALKIIFQKSSIFDGVKLIFDVQRYSITYSEPNFEFQSARCIVQKNWETVTNFRPKVLPPQIFRIYSTCRSGLYFPTKTSADTYRVSQIF